MRGQRRLAIAKWVTWLGPGAIALLSLLREQYPTATGGRIRDLLWGQYLDWHIWVVVGITLAIVAAKAGQEYLEATDVARLKRMLDTMHATYFSGVPESERYHNRVTLFRANRNRTLLLAVCRSGSQFQRNIQPLAISDDVEVANEGVAGLAWFTDSTVMRAQLPAPPESWDAEDPACQEYASQGLMPIDKAGRLNVRSRSILATPIRDSKGTRWGVLVLDSRAPDGVDPNKQPMATAFAAAISNML
jgi:hypothetical protein